MLRSAFALSLAVSVSAVPTASRADPAAATTCPPYSFVDSKNLVRNPSFETAGAKGPSTNCPHPCTVAHESAAAGWAIHGTNNPPGSAIATKLVPTNVPFGTDPDAGKRMLQIDSTGGETDVSQVLTPPAEHAIDGPGLGLCGEGPRRAAAARQQYGTGLVER